MTKTSPSGPADAPDTSTRTGASESAATPASAGSGRPKLVDAAVSAAKVRIAFEQAIDPETGEVLDAKAEALLSAELESAEYTQKECLIACGVVVTELKAVGERLKNLEDDYKRKRGMTERRIAWLEDYMSQHHPADLKIKDVVSISWKQNPPAVHIADLSVVPRELMQEQPPVPDKKRMAEMLKAGQIIPGVTMQRKRRYDIR